MKRKIKVVQFGTGKMSVYTMQYALEKGCQIVGAIDINPELIGKDIGEILGKSDIGIKVTSYENAEELLKKVKPDICIVTTQSLLIDLYEPLKICAKLGINAITTCEEAFYPMNSNPTTTNALDIFATTTGCTITGTGYQEIYWGELVSKIAASTHNITKIKGSSSYNVEEYGIALAQAHGAGLTLEEFEDKIASVDNISDDARKVLIESGHFLPAYMWNTNGWLASKLGLTVTSQRQKCIPTTNNEDIESSTLKMTVKQGNATGMRAVVTTETLEGIIIETECIGKIYAENEFDKNEWTVYGEPDTTVTVSKPNTVELTCATIVNRIPDVINAKPGFITTDKMPELTYRAKPLNEYVNKED